MENATAETATAETATPIASGQSFVTMVAGMTAETFQDVIASSPRRIRETLFGRLGIKAKKRGLGIQVHGKQEERTRKLHERLKLSTTKQENDLCEELVRNWLFTKRPMLKAALDHLGIANDNGLIEEEPTFFQELEATKVKELWAALTETYPAEHVRLYLEFVRTPHLDQM